MDRSNSFRPARHPEGSVLSKWLIVVQDATLIKTRGCVNLKYGPLFFCRHAYCLHLLYSYQHALIRTYKTNYCRLLLIKQCSSASGETRWRWTSSIPSTNFAKDDHFKMPQVDQIWIRKLSI